MTLTAIAQQMHQETAASGQPAKRKLNRGLALSLTNQDGHMRLTAGRVDVHPSEKEALIIARAFGVPIGTDPDWGTLHDRTTGNHWHTITWRWIELPAHQHPTQPGLINPGPTYN